MEKANDRQVGGDHYKSGFQHWDLISINRIGYLEGCASKYATRWKRKNGAEDVQKGIHYCDKILDMIDEYGYRPSGHAPYSDLIRFYRENDVEDEDARIAISGLCQWSCADQIYAAKGALERLFQKAKGLATVG